MMEIDAAGNPVDYATGKLGYHHAFLRSPYDGNVRYYRVDGELYLVDDPVMNQPYEYVRTPRLYIRRVNNMYIGSGYG